MTYEHLAVKAAAEVYRHIDGEVRNVQYDIFRYPNLQCTVVAFAGSNELWDWRRHLLVRRQRVPGYNVLVHRGWLADWNAARHRVMTDLNDCYQYRDWLILCGHSYGGALAQVAALDIARHYSDLRIYTFGSPRVGNKDFAKTLDAVANFNYRYTIAGDPVPHLPLGLRYKHAGMHTKLPYRPMAHRVQNYVEALS